jgi:hypothetical protein
MCLNETYNRVRTGKNLSHKFSIENGLKEGDALSPLLFNFALEYAIRKVRKNQEGLIFNGTHQLLACADNFNTVVENIDTVTNSQVIFRDGSLLHSKLNTQTHSTCGHRPSVDAVSLPGPVFHR